MGAEQNNRQHLEAQATAQQEDGVALATLGKVLPALSARGSFTHNEYSVELRVAQLFDPGAPTASRGLVLIPANQLDAQLRVEVPLINIAGWLTASASRAQAEAWGHAAHAARLDVQRQVAREYYQLLGAQALLRGSQRRLVGSTEVANLVQQRHSEGVVPLLDLQRARAAEAHSHQALSDAAMAVALAERALLTLTGLAPQGEAPAMEFSLEEEADLASWEGAGSEAIPTVAAALANRRSADLAAWAGKLAWAPTVVASAQESFTNATGFVGRSATWTAGATATWQLDVGLAGNMAAQDARAQAARLHAERQGLAARDQIHAAWLRVHSGIDKVRAAQAEASWALQAKERALVRYQEGQGSQIEFIEAEREAFAAEHQQIQLVADLAYARASLRLQSGQLLKEGTS